MGIFEEISLSILKRIQHMHKSGLYSVDGRGEAVVGDVTVDKSLRGSQSCLQVKNSLHQDPKMLLCDSNMLVS